MSAPRTIEKSAVETALEAAFAGLRPSAHAAAAFGVVDGCVTTVGSGPTGSAPPGRLDELQSYLFQTIWFGQG